jgi:hypothetical protein
MVSSATLRLAAPKQKAHTLFMLPDEQATPEQIQIFRRMTPERRLALAEQLYWSARRMKTAWLRQQHPEWTEDHLKAEVTKIFLHART